MDQAQNETMKFFWVSFKIKDGICSVFNLVDTSEGLSEAFNDWMRKVYSQTKETHGWCAIEKCGVI